MATKSAPPVDSSTDPLAGKTPEQLDELIAQAQALKAAKADEARQAVRTKVFVLIDKSGIPFERIFAEELVKPVRVAGTKYSDGTNVWSGRGKHPNWLKDKLAAGAKLEDFAVKA